MGTGVLSQGVKRQGREADQSHPSSAEVKNKWRYNSTPKYAFMAWTGTLYRPSIFFFFSIIGYTSVKGFIAVWLNTLVCFVFF